MEKPDKEPEKPEKPVNDELVAALTYGPCIVCGRPAIGQHGLCAKHL